MKTEDCVFPPGNLLAIRAWDIVSQLFANQRKIHLKLLFTLGRKSIGLEFFGI